MKLEPIKLNKAYSDDGPLGVMERGLSFLTKAACTFYYRLRFEKFGKNSVVTGRISLRGGKRIQVGEGVVIEGGSLFRVEGTGEIRIQDGVFIEKGSRLMAKGELHLGEKVYVLKDAFIVSNGRVDLGDRTWVAAGCLVAGGDIILEKDVILGPGVFIMDGDHRIDPAGQILMESGIRRPVRIEANAWLGARSIVLKGVTVGKGAVVGAGSVVTRNADPQTVYCGVPARAVKKVPA